MFLDVAVPAGKEGHSYAGGTVKKANLLLLAIVLTAANCFAQYSYQAIDFTGAVRTRIFAVNNRGEFVGAFWDTANNAHAIFFDGKDLARVDPNGVIGQSTRSWAYALNDHGQMVGRILDSSGVFHGYLFDGTVITLMDYPGAASTESYGINNRGDIIGVFHDTGGILHSFQWHDGTFTQTDLPNGETVPLSINDQGEAVGEFADVPNTAGHGYLQLKNGSFTLYDVPGAPANSTFFISINNRNDILNIFQQMATRTLF